MKWNDGSYILRKYLECLTAYIDQGVCIYNKNETRYYTIEHVTIIVVKSELKQWCFKPGKRFWVFQRYSISERLRWSNSCRPAEETIEMLHITYTPTLGLCRSSNVLYFDYHSS